MRKVKVDILTMPRKVKVRLGNLGEMVEKKITWKKMKRKTNYKLKEQRKFSRHVFQMRM